jgi:excisionase family DNA binding protein
MLWQSLPVNDVLASVPAISFDEAAELLGISVGKVRRLVEEHSLISFRRGVDKVIPAETIVDGEPLHSLRGTIVLLLDCGVSLQEGIEWLYQPNDLLGETPMASLLAGHKSPVRRAAQMLAQ